MPIYGKVEIKIMAMMKLCRCNNPILISQKLCKACSEKSKADTKERYKKYDTEKRDERSTEFYRSKAWRRTRIQALSRDHHLCQVCLGAKRITPATLVDHIEPVRIAWERRLDLTNLQALCDKCHRTKTARDKRAYRL